MSQAKLQKSSEKLVKKLMKSMTGKATYTVVIPESTNQNTGETIPASETPYPISTYQRSGSLKELESNQVTQTQKIFLIEAQSIIVKPSAEDEILMNGETFKFSSILKEVNAGQTTVLYYVVAGV